MTDIAILCWTLLWTGPTAGLTAPPAELGVTQSPGRLTVLRGETATLCCHFTVPSQWRGFQWFRMNPDRQSILPSARYVFLEKNQSSSLLITEAAPKDSGEYYCEVSVPYQDPEWGNGTLLTVLAPPSSPRLYLQTPADPQIDLFSLVCVTWGFYPSDLSLYWTNRSAASPIDRLSINNCTLSSSSNTTTATADPLQSPQCVRLEDTRTSEVYLISVLPLPDREYMEAGVTYACVVEGHPAMTEPLTASYMWEAPPNLLIGALNILKMCFLSAMTAIFSLEAVKHWCS
ncbi:tyrosine-protein phosphatase non-receptor type substrate 1-like [Periophthalmus magnuspinnatus]|uniref:tyrosine-protein phosphatase non-receptor type substrate 1-like n=1 Tax=Periophthalmus magnuspinnatus TaxID=409849 RepID=UPI002436B959|nr:tyrosine-protein phosphatase non-receptor type substrate 1-like [Periophthalmus magnuspinnatus]